MKNNLKILIAFLGSSFILLFLSHCTKSEDAMSPSAINLDNLEPRTFSILPLDSLSIGLEANYKFDNNVHDQVLHLADVTCTTFGGAGYSPVFTSNRFGQGNKALKLNGFYMGKINNVPKGNKYAVSLWARMSTSSYPQLGAYPQNRGICTSGSEAFNLVQSPTASNYIYTYRNLLYVSKNSDLGWHHIVLTYDGSTYKYYIDNVLFYSKTDFTASINTTTPYFLAPFTSTDNVNGDFWKGAIDDLRFYSRNLSPNDISRLYSLK